MVFSFYPLFDKGRYKFDLPLLVIGSAVLRVKDIKGQPLCAFCPLAGAFFVIVRPIIGMEGGKDIANLFFDVCAVPRSHKLFRRYSGPLPLYQRPTAFSIGNIRTAGTQI